jgi:hypothetical protein
LEVFLFSHEGMSDEKVLLPSEERRSLVSEKLKGVALRTPPPSDTFIVQCFVMPETDGIFTYELCTPAARAEVTVVPWHTPTTQSIVRLPVDATPLHLLLKLGLIDDNQFSKGTCSVASCEGGTRSQLFELRAALGDGRPHPSYPPADLTKELPLRTVMPGLRFPFCVAITPSSEALRRRGAIGHSPAMTMDVHRREVTDPFANVTSLETQAISSSVEPEEPESSPLPAREGSIQPLITTTMEGDSVAEGSSPTSENLSAARRSQRALAAAERARIAELQAVRERRIAEKEEAQRQRDAEARERAKEREKERAEAAQVEARALVERRVRIESRTKLVAKAKEALELERHTRLSEQREELRQKLELARQAITCDDLRPTSASPACAPPSEPYPLSVVGSGSLYELPSAGVADSAVCENTSFLARVSESGRTSERRLSRFVVAKKHPFETSATLADVLHSLDSSVEQSADAIARAQAEEREAKREREIEEFHRRIVEESTAQRAKIKLERKDTQIAKHVAEIQFHRLQKELDEAAKKKEAQERAAQLEAFRKRKIDEEQHARRIAQQEKELATYIERQRKAVSQPLQ